MNPNNLLKLQSIRNKLIKEIRKNKLEDYKEGYYDGVLDTYNLFMDEFKNEEKTKTT